MIYPACPDHRHASAKQSAEDKTQRPSRENGPRDSVAVVSHGKAHQAEARRPQQRRQDDPPASAAAPAQGEPPKERRCGGEAQVKSYRNELQLSVEQNVGGEIDGERSQRQGQKHGYGAQSDDDQAIVGR